MSMQIAMSKCTEAFGSRMQKLGVISMTLSSCDIVGFESGTKDSRVKRIMVVFNATADAVDVAWPEGRFPMAMVLKKAHLIADAQTLFCA